MTLHPQVIADEASWPQPIEMVYQLLGGGDASGIAPKLPHLGMSDILFMSSIMMLPRERRPWGIVTWLSEVFQLSRPALYDLTKRSAFRATRQVMVLEKKLRKAWEDDLFSKYVTAVENEEKRYVQHAAFVTWFDHLCDALEIVDLPSGVIRDKATNQWLLDESLNAMAAIEHDRVQKWLTTLRRYQTQILTWMDWLEPTVDAFQHQLAQVIDHPSYPVLRPFAQSNGATLSSAFSSTTGLAPSDGSVHSGHVSTRS